MLFRSLNPPTLNFQQVMEIPKAWDDRSPLNYEPLQAHYSRILINRPRRGDTSWKDRVAAELKGSAASKKAVDAWLGHAFAKVIESDPPKLVPSKGPYKPEDYTHFVEFYRLMNSSDQDWEAEAYINRVRRSRGLEHGVRNVGDSDPQTWGKVVTRITGIGDAERSSPAPPAASTSRANKNKRKAPEADTSKQAKTTTTKTQPKKTAAAKGKKAPPPAKKATGRGSRAKPEKEKEEPEEENDEDAAADADAEGEVDTEGEEEEAVERPAKRRKASSPVGSDLTDIEDSAKAEKPKAAGKSKKQVAKKESTEESTAKDVEEEEAAPSKSKAPTKATKKTPVKKTPAKKAPKSKAAKPAEEDEEKGEPEAAAEEEEPTSAKAAKRQTKPRKSAAKSKAAAEPEDMDVDEPEPAEEVAHEAHDATAPPTTDEAEPESPLSEDEYTSPPENHFQESDLRSAPPPASSARKPPAKAVKPASKAAAAEPKTKAASKVEPEAKAKPVSKAKPASKAAPKSTKPVSRAKPVSKKATTSKLTPPPSIPPTVSEDKDEQATEDQETANATAGDKMDVDTSKTSTKKPAKVATALTGLDYGSDDPVSPQVSLSPSPSDREPKTDDNQQIPADDAQAAGDVDAKAANNTNGAAPSSSTSGTQAPAPEKATRKSGRRSIQPQPNGGLADIYNTAFSKNAALNKQMTPKGQEKRFNSEAG